jgi:predicted transcriptional regulator
MEESIKKTEIVLNALGKDTKYAKEMSFYLDLFERHLNLLETQCQCKHIDIIEEKDEGGDSYHKIVYEICKDCKKIIKKRED